MTWYVTSEPCHASVPCFVVHDPSGAEWSIDHVIVFWEGPDSFVFTRASGFDCDLCAPRGAVAGLGF